MAKSPSGELVGSGALQDLPSIFGQPLIHKRRPCRHGYLASLRREYLPLFWSEAELSLLQGTDADQRALADRSATSHVGFACNLLKDLMQRAFAGSAKALVLAALKTGISRKERDEIEKLLREDKPEDKP